MVIVVFGVLFIKKDIVGLNGYVWFKVKGNFVMFYFVFKVRILIYFVIDFVIGNNVE